MAEDNSSNTEVDMTVIQAVGEAQDNTKEEQQQPQKRGEEQQVEQRREQGETGEGDGASSTIVDVILLQIVRGVLLGVQGAVVFGWVLGKVSEALAWAVELGLLLLGQGQPPR